MELKRELHLNSSGSDVLWIKRKLFALGYYAPAIASVERVSFGGDTRAAVRAFQQRNVDEDGNRLRTDGVIDKRTWDAIVRFSEVEQPFALPGNIGKLAASVISPELGRVDGTRRQLVLKALPLAYDPQVPSAYPLSLYIRGGNLYHADLKENVITAARIRSGAKRQPQYYSNGRMEMMLEAVRLNPLITGADCSGGIVGLMRHFQLVKPAFDATADMLTGARYSAATNSNELRAGDWVGRPGHIGIYAGGGYVVEWMGGAYGCQLSKLARRRGFDFVSHKLVSRPAWTRFRRPDAY